MYDVKKVQKYRGVGGGVFTWRDGGVQFETCLLASLPAADSDSNTTRRRRTVFSTYYTLWMPFTVFSMYYILWMLFTVLHVLHSVNALHCLLHVLHSVTALFCLLHVLQSVNALHCLPMYYILWMLFTVLHVLQPVNALHCLLQGKGKQEI